MEMVRGKATTNLKKNQPLKVGRSCPIWMAWKSNGDNENQYERKDQPLLLSPQGENESPGLRRHSSYPNVRKRCPTFIFRARKGSDPPHGPCSSSRPRKDIQMAQSTQNQVYFQREMDGEFA